MGATFLGALQALLNLLDRHTAELGSKFFGAGIVAAIDAPVFAALGPIVLEDVPDQRQGARGELNRVQRAQWLLPPIGGRRSVYGAHGQIGISRSQLHEAKAQVREDELLEL